jgi:hypothetical protein
VALLLRSSIGRYLMPSSRRIRRQEIRKRRRQARRSLNQMLLDDDLYFVEEDDAAEPLYELAPRRYGFSEGRLRSVVLSRIVGG